MCHPDSYCNNTIGSYLCICNIGYSGDGFINCTSESTENISITASIVHFCLQILMNVNLTLMTVMRMLSALIPLEASVVIVTLDTVELGQNAVSNICYYRNICN